MKEIWIILNQMLISHTGSGIAVFFDDYSQNKSTRDIKFGWKIGKCTINNSLHFELDWNVVMVLGPKVPKPNEVEGHIIPCTGASW